METVNYGTFSESVHRGAATERLPLSGTIEVNPPLSAYLRPLLQQFCPWLIATREVAS